MQTIIFHSPLSPDDALKALRLGVDDEKWGFSLSGYRGDFPIVGKFYGESFRLRKRILYNNGGARLFYGRLVPEAHGTRVEGHFAVPGFGRFFMWLWFVPVTYVCGRVFLTHGAKLLTGEVEIGNLIPLGMLLGGLLIFQIGRLLSRGGERFIEEYLQDRLQAQAE